MGKSIAIIGAGIAGITQAIRLTEKFGESVQITIYEAKGDIGGVWRDAIWPGAEVDILIQVYQLYSDLNPNWNRAYASRAEVFYYWQSLVDKYDLRRKIYLNTRLTSGRWDPNEKQYTLELESADRKWEEHASILIAATGPLNTARYPDVPGRSSFNGTQFHSLDWPVDFDLSNKRFAVIGSGSTATQMIPGLSEARGSSVVQFIRSPGWYLPKHNFAFPWYVKRAFAHVPGVQWLYRCRLHWMWNSRSTIGGKGRWTTWYRRRMEAKLLRLLHTTVPAKYHRALTPNHELGVKRIVRDAGWLQSLSKENVDLTASPIVQITPHGLVTKDGNTYDVDVMVWATGFEVATKGCGLSDQIFGEGGRELATYWDEIGGPEAYYGVSVPGWPNYFIVVGPNSLSNNWSQVISATTIYISQLVERLVRDDVDTLQPKVSAFKQYNAYIQGLLRNSVFYTPGVASWDKVGRDHGKITVSNGMNASAFMWMMRKPRWKDWEAVKDGVESPLQCRTWYRSLHLGIIGTVGSLFAWGFLSGRWPLPILKS